MRCAVNREAIEGVRHIRGVEFEKPLDQRVAAEDGKRCQPSCSLLILLQAFESRIEGVPEGIAQEIKTKHRHTHRETREEHQPRRNFNEFLPGDR